MPASVARLEIRLLGSFDVSLEGDPVTDFESASVRALFACLATEPGRAWSRPVLAEMLWPERPQGAALANLRHALSVVRRAIGDHAADHPCLLVDRSMVAIDPSADVWVDLVELEDLAARPADQAGVAEGWERAAALWRGPLLEGLQVRAGAEWEAWHLVTAERACRRMVSVLRRLANRYERAGEWERAIPITERLTKVDPWDERTHRQLMRLLARSGESALAVAHFEGLRNRLRQELGTEPAAETTALLEQVRRGKIPNAAAEVEAACPEFLTKTPKVAPAPLFVGRERELADLSTQLESALAGRGRVVLVAGEAGSGKTMLAAEFMRRATEAVPDLLVARGRCNAYSGLGDPYLPFREVLGLLSGDVESSFIAGAIDREQATRLWEATPHTARLVTERSPSLVGVMVNGPKLLRHAEEAVSHADWLEALRTHVEASEALPPAPERMQPALFDEYTAVLEGLSATHPLLLIVDDLQWADRGSIAQLWHLARRLEGVRLLIVGVYRPEEIVDSGGEHHPLEPVLRELQAATTDCTIELGPDRGFVDAFIDSEPNDLDTGFRDRLFSYTNGHPLFTVEMVRGMQEGAEIRRNRAGVWTADRALDWHRLPSRVEAAISQRINRLPTELRNDLIVAAVQGEEFVAETVAAVRGDPDSPTRLSRESTASQRLIEPSGVTRIDGRLAARHRFRHVLFQRYLYHRLDEAERIRLHEATGRALEDLYRAQPDQPVVDLAHHFDEAQLAELAIGYLYRAGQRAIRMSANEEAIRLLERALVRVRTLPDSHERDRRELDLLVALGGPIVAARGWSAPEGERIGLRSRELCERLEPSAAGAMALIGLAQTQTVRARHRAAAEASRESLAIAQKLDDPTLRVLASFELGYCLMWAGELAESHDHLRESRDLHDPERDAWLTHVFGSDPGAAAMAYGGSLAHFRGHRDEALALTNAAIALARSLAHPFTLCHVLAVATVNRSMRGDYGDGLALAEEVEAIANTEHFAFWSASTDIYRGWATGHLGDPESGARSMERGIDAWRAMGFMSLLGFFSCALAELHHRRGQTAQGLEVIERTLIETRATDEHLSDVLLQVERGRLLGGLGDAAATHALVGAIDAARSIGARDGELRAATSLASLLDAQRRTAEARQALEPVFSSFTEGLDTPDLVAARQVLERL